MREAFGRRAGLPGSDRPLPVGGVHVDGPVVVDPAPLVRVSGTPRPPAGDGRSPRAGRGGGLAVGATAIGLGTGVGSSGCSLGGVMAAGLGIGVGSSGCSLGGATAAGLGTGAGSPGCSLGATPFGFSVIALLSVASAVMAAFEPTSRPGSLSVMAPLLPPVARLSASAPPRGAHNRGCR